MCQVYDGLVALIQKVDRKHIDWKIGFHNESVSIIAVLRYNDVQNKEEK